MANEAKKTEPHIAEEHIEAKSDPGPAVDQAANDPRVDQALGIFGNLSALEVKPGDQVGAREILSTIAVRKPKKNEYVRVDPERSLTTVVYTDDADGEVYFVAPHLRPMMIAGCTTKLLVLAVNQAGVPFIWPVPTDDETQRKNTWNESARAGFHRAKTEWVKLVGDRANGLYRVFLAEGKLPAPRFPDKPFPDLLALGFNNRLIDNEDHHVIRQMRGLTV
jgi:hypothetical protein